MDWNGKWIGGSYEFLKGEEGKSPIPVGKWLTSDDFLRMHYRKDFEINDSSLVKSVEIYIDYDFECEIFINGTIVKNGFITSLCTNGTNHVAVRAFLPNKPEMFTMAIRGGVEITYKDGQKENILTDLTWKGGYTYWGGVEREDWHCSTIQHLSRITEWDIHPRSVKRSLLMRKTFELHEEIESATAYATAKGFYTLFVNGLRASDALLTPGITPIEEGMTDFLSSRVIYYQQYDITNILKKGENALGIMTANGWYASESHTNMRTHRNEVLADITIKLKSGKTIIISTDNTWRVGFSPLTDNDLQLGERYDARLELENWNIPCFEDKEWGYAEETNEDYSNISPQAFNNVRITDVLSPVRLIKISEDVTIFDFGQNNSGRAELFLNNTKAGQRIVIQYAEEFEEDGSLAISPYENVFYREDTLVGARSEWGLKNHDVYICAGKEQEIYRPQYAYAGFRYVQLSGYSDATFVTVCYNVFHTDLPVSGNFECSDKLLNGILEITKRSFTSNLHYGPTDCPTREKNFWNGDLQMFVPTAPWLFDCNSLLSSWTTEGRKLYAGAPAWIDENYITPWYLYLFYGNTEVLANNYSKIKELVERRIADSKDGICLAKNYGHFGDHAAPKGVTNLDAEYFLQLYFYYSVMTIAKIAGVLGKNEEQNHYNKIAKIIFNAVNEKYYNTASGTYCDEQLGSQILAVAFELVPQIRLAAMIDKIEEIIIKNNYTWACGTASLAYLLPILTENGKLETAWKLAVQTEYPSFGYMLAMGATTLYEGWEYNTKGSNNHYFRGSICRWFSEYLCGIKYDEAAPGFDEIIIKPYLPQKLDYASFSFISRHGEIISKWHKSKCETVFEITIPQGVLATIALPNSEPILKNGGCYVFKI